MHPLPPPRAPSQYTRLDPDSQHPQSTHSTSTHGPLDPVPCRPLGQSALSDHPIFAVSWPAGQSARQPPGQSAPCRGSLGVGWWRGRSPIECWGGGGAPALLHAEMWGPRVLTLTARCAAHRILPTHHFFFPSPPSPPPLHGGEGWSVGARSCCSAGQQWDAALQLSQSRGAAPEWPCSCHCAEGL